nr:hypothetical protein CFP56_76883 [Quercus suber]
MRNKEGGKAETEDARRHARGHGPVLKCGISFLLPEIDADTFFRLERRLSRVINDVYAMHMWLSCSPRVTCVTNMHEAAYRKLPIYPVAI